MKFYIYLLLGLLGLFAGSYFMHALANNPGLIIISVGDKVLQVGFWFGIFLLICAALTITFVWKFLRFVWRWLASSVSWIKESRDKRAHKRTQEGLLNFVEENWLAAKKNLLSAAKDTDKPVMHYLAASKSAYRMGNREESVFLLEQAGKIAPPNDLHVVLSRARFFLLEQDYIKSQAALDNLDKSLKTKPAVLDIQQQLYVCEKNWQSLIHLLPQLKTSGIFSSSEYERLEENAYLSLLDQFASEEKATAQSLSEVWQSFPKAVKKKSHVIGLFCSRLHRLGDDEQAAELIKMALKAHWHKGLVELFGNIESSNLSAQLAAAEKWLRDHPNDSCLLRTLGRLSVKNALWGKAKDYFEASLKIEERPEVYSDLGALMKQRGELEKSAYLYERGLALISN